MNQEKRLINGNPFSGFKIQRFHTSEILAMGLPGKLVDDGSFFWYAVGPEFDTVLGPFHHSWDAYRALAVMLYPRRAQ